MLEVNYFWNNFIKMKNQNYDVPIYINNVTLFWKRHGY